MSNAPRPKLKPPITHIANPDTKFYVDYDWWKESQRDLKSHLYSRLPNMTHTNLDTEMDLIDLIDADTGEVYSVDGFQYLVKKYFQQLPEDYLTRSSTVDAVFCALMANGNQPMSARDIAKRIQRDVDVILKTFGGPHVHEGIRPILDE